MTLLVQKQRGGRQDYILADGVNAMPEERVRADGGRATGETQANNNDIRAGNTSNTNHGGGNRPNNEDPNAAGDLGFDHDVYYDANGHERLTSWHEPDNGSNFSFASVSTITDGNAEVEYRLSNKFQAHAPRQLQTRSKTTVTPNSSKCSTNGAVATSMTPRRAVPRRVEVPRQQTRRNTAQREHTVTVRRPPAHSIAHHPFQPPSETLFRRGNFPTGKSQRKH
ncbi:hypothetical protein SEMRO_676_G185700.1 [Seminavis robusta]|uniref:Uncharacterized protein n=1 Tax=Seminavis robusta TaxID=568900 RepID=A0A9N8E516_9STRA|nr:hypothetical protein SEMRO_676_G185700.1 [Seminavis robusta]|eukprot:Sro676_g185700.1 n/a (224) ;mRNA; r:33066-33737